MSASREYYLSAIETVCVDNCGQMDVRKTLEHMVDQQGRYEKCLSDFAWYARLGARLAPENVSPSSAASSRSTMWSPEPDAMNGWDMRVIEAILQKLDYSLKDQEGDLRTFIHNQIGVELKNKISDAVAITQFFKNANLFPAMQYILALSLLTGGKGMAEIELAELRDLLKKAKLQWTDFFNDSFPKEFWQIAIEKDDPNHLLILLDRPRFLFKDVLIKINNVTLVEYLLSNNKPKILLSLLNDLSASEVACIKNIAHLVRDLENQPLIELVINKLSTCPESIERNGRIKKLLNCMRDMLEKAMLKNDLNHDLQNFALTLTTSIQLELGSLVLVVDEALFNTFLIFLEKFKLDSPLYHAVLTRQSSSYAEESQLVTAASFFRHNPYYPIYDEKHQHLSQAMSADQPVLVNVLHALQACLEAGIDYHQSKDIEKNKDHYLVGWALKKSYILTLGFQLGFLSVPDFALQLQEHKNILNKNQIHITLMTDLKTILAQFSGLFNENIHQQAKLIIQNRLQMPAPAINAKYWGLKVDTAQINWYHSAAIAVLQTAAKVDVIMLDKSLGTEASASPSL